MTIYPWHLETFQQLATRAAALPHAQLFKGPIGTGKRGFAQAVAKGILCEKPISALSACGACSACHWFDTNNHPDFRLIQPEAAESSEEPEATEKKKKREISIAQIRSLAEFINISSHRNGAKVVVIQPAEAMNVNAANALLKSLEEPPPDTYFLLVSDRPNMLPATLRSRCQQLALPPPSAAEAADWLAKSGISKPELALAQAGGAPVLAAELDTPEYWTLRQQFLDGLKSGSFDPAMMAERFATQPIPQLINWLQRWTYDLASVTAGQRLRYNPDRSEILDVIAKRLKLLDVLHFHRELVRFQRIVNHPLNARLLLEDLLMRYGNMVRA